MSLFKKKKNSQKNKKNKQAGHQDDCPMCHVSDEVVEQLNNSKEQTDKN